MMFNGSNRTAQLSTGNRLSRPAVMMPTGADAAKFRLFCLPYAGGGTLAFRGWERQLAPADIAICPIQLPGREQRFDQSAYTSLAQLIPDLAAAMQPYLHQPFIIFGYSMGALIGFELTRYLRSHYFSLPSAIIIGAANPPHWQNPQPPLYHLSDQDLISKIQQFNGTPQAVLQNAELMALLLPLLRADFQLLETYHHTVDRPLDLPILAFGGQFDSTVTVASLLSWQQHTTIALRSQLFDGDHFFITSHHHQLLSAIGEFVASHIQH
jgi:medium-chain acyl-[acyl-carrier-protein] hydrolase